MLYDLTRMNVQRTKDYLADTYNKHIDNSSDMLMRVRITRRVLSVLHLHPDWNEDDIFRKVQDAFRKGKGTDIARKIDRELYSYFKQYWLDIIKLEDIEIGKEFDHYAQWSNVHLTQEQYIAKARAKWGDAYDYSESVFLAGLKPITIRCIKHDHFFTVQAGNHISTSQRPFSGGCPLCAQERLAEYRRKQHEETLRKAKQKKRTYKTKPRLTPQERFLKKASAMYPDYDFSRVEYKDSETYIVVVCPAHGEFKIRPRTLLRGEKGKKPHGCWKCNGMVPPYERESGMEYFKRRMHELYGDKYTFVWSDFKRK